MNSPANTITPSLHTTGFTLVEEDDVAFSISLCKEIHRLYGSYQSGDLEADDSVHLGLSLTVQVLGTLAGTVNRGMPAMRIDVAVAQTREMMAVMFDEPLTPKVIRGSRQQVDRRCSRALGTPTAAVTLKSNAPRASIRSGEHGAVAETETTTSTQFASPPNPAPDESQPINPRPEGEAMGHGLRRWFGRRSLAVRVVLAVIGCVAAAVLVDVPIVMMLLYSNMCGQLLVAYIAVGLWARSTFRKRRRPDIAIVPAAVAI